jgi:hypothetical protein
MKLESSRAVPVHVHVADGEHVLMGMRRRRAKRLARSGKDRPGRSSCVWNGGMLRGRVFVQSALGGGEGGCAMVKGSVVCIDDTGNPGFNLGRAGGRGANQAAEVRVRSDAPREGLSSTLVRLGLAKSTAGRRWRLAALQVYGE